MENFDPDWIDRVNRRRHKLTLDQASYAVTRRALLRHEDIARAAKEFDSMIGVYFLIRSDKVVYVGQSNNVHARVQQHRNIDRKEFERWAFIQCERNQLNVLESLYIMALQPEDNGRNVNNEYCVPLTLDKILQLITEARRAA